MVLLIQCVGRKRLNQLRLPQRDAYLQSNFVQADSVN